MAPRGNWACVIGGIWWDKNHTYVNAIANELFFSVAAHLANRAGSTTYLSWAQRAWSWFNASGMINAESSINDGLDLNTCKNNNGNIWSYNQGVILGGLIELNRAAPDPNLIPMAHRIALAAIAHLTDSNGILHDPCEPNCGPDGGQFKGVFMRNLQMLGQASPVGTFQAIIEKNADSIWEHDRNGSTLSVIWSGPFIAPANASTQSSALDCLVAAAVLS